MWRAGRLHYRRRAPTSLLLIVGKREVWRSLGTHSLKPRLRVDAGSPCPLARVTTGNDDDSTVCAIGRCLDEDDRPEPRRLGSPQPSTDKGGLDLQEDPRPARLPATARPREAGGAAVDQSAMTAFSSYRSPAAVNGLPR